MNFKIQDKKHKKNTIVSLISFKKYPVITKSFFNPIEKLITFYKIIKIILCLKIDLC